MKFKFSAKKYSILFIIILFIMLIGLFYTTSELINKYIVDSSYENIRTALKHTVFFAILTIFCLVFTFYILRYLIIIEGDILIIRLMFKKKKYNLKELTSYHVTKDGRNTKFLVWFGEKRRIIVTVDKEPLNDILSEYIVL